MGEYQISVRNLVEFLARSGDLDEGEGSFDQEAMRKGSRLHLRIQKSQESGYRAEVVLKDKVVQGETVLRIEGRADGIFEEDGLVFIDEIKGISSDVSLLTAPVDVHRAQAVCYAAIFLSQQGLDRIGIQMTYGNLDTGETRRFREELQKDWLLNWYREITAEYGRWVGFREQCIRKRNESMQGLEFPFPYREGQRKIVRGAFIAMKEGRQFFVQAPTGVGKTMSVVFPAVRALGEGYGELIFYLTAKTVTRMAALEAFRILAGHGLRLRVIALTAKEKLCMSDECRCNPRNCLYARGHFDRVNHAVFTLWHEREVYDRETILEYACRYQVCPFEMSLDLALWVDAVICDYNYVFAPDVSLKRFFGEGSRRDYLFLVDEAHNLVERGREMYSASVCREEVAAARRLCKERDRPMAKCLERLSRRLLTLKKEMAAATRERLSPPGLQDMELDGISPMLEADLWSVRREMEKRMEEKNDPELTEMLLDLYFQIRRFLETLELVDENYIVFCQNDENGKFRLHLYCVNPAKNLALRLEKGRSALFFSATLFPLSYYRRLLSLREDAYGLYIPSPFSPRNRMIITVSDVSSRYNRRCASEYRKIASCIAGAVSAKAGNYLVFFPSFRMLEEVRNVIGEELSSPQTRLICQEPSMSEADRESFLGEFETEMNDRTQTLIGFAVLGGIFSEGIDLQGTRLIGAVVVGTGLDRINSGAEKIRSFYDRKGMKGFAYAYRNPGMNKVLQACGRVIRTASDYGVILLLDDRFLQREYRELFPPEWNDMRICRSGEIRGILDEFWRRKKGEE